MIELIDWLNECELVCMYSVIIIINSTSLKKCAWRRKKVLLWGKTSRNGRTFIRIYLVTFSFVWHLLWGRKWMNESVEKEVKKKKKKKNCYIKRVLWEWEKRKTEKRVKIDAETVNLYTGFCVGTRVSEREWEAASAASINEFRNRIKARSCRLCTSIDRSTA